MTDVAASHRAPASPATQTWTEWGLERLDDAALAVGEGIVTCADAALSATSADYRASTTGGATAGERMIRGEYAGSSLVQTAEGDRTLKTTQDAALTTAAVAGSIAFGAAATARAAAQGASAMVASAIGGGVSSGTFSVARQLAEHGEVRAAALAADTAIGAAAGAAAGAVDEALQAAGLGPQVVSPLLGKSIVATAAASVAAAGTVAEQVASGHPVDAQAAGWHALVAGVTELVGGH